MDLGREAPKTASDCDRLVLRHPEDLDAWRCYLHVARAFGEWSGAIASLESRLIATPDAPAALLYLGRLRTDRYEPGGVENMLAAAEGFARAGNAPGEVEARLSAAEALRRSGDAASAEVQVAKAEAVAIPESPPRLRAKVAAARARQHEVAGDVAAARARFEEAALLLRDDPDALLLAFLENGLGGLAWYEGRLEDAYRHYLRAADLYAASGDRQAEASERYNAALAAGRGIRGFVSEAELRLRLQEAFDAAIASGSPSAEASVRLLRAQDGSRSAEARLAEAERAAALCRRTGDVSKYTFALRLAAILAPQVDPERGPERRDRLLAESLEISASRNHFADLARTHAILGDFARGVPDLAAAADHYERGVDAIERLRDNQPDELAAARHLWDWAFLYYRLVGSLLDSAQHEPGGENFDRAFRALERLRARASLQSLDDARATAVTGRAGSEERRAREDILREIASVQRRLLAPGLSRDGTDRLAADLRRLETRERAARVELSRADPTFANWRYPEIVGVRDVQEALDSREALLSFQMSTREFDDRKWYWNGGSWVIVVTKDAVRAHPLPESDVVTRSIAAFLGLLERREDVGAEPGAGLYDELLRTAVEGLSPEIDRLIVVPAGAIHRLPLAVLGPADGKPLGTRYALARVPSASWWVERRRSKPAKARRASLSLADPPLPAIARSGGAERGGSWLRGLDLTPLPRAREEARKVASAVGDGTIWLGEDASEAALATVALRRYGLLHFAAHAVVDDRHPESSALVLAPGADDEDGLLQIREIVGLETPGTIVLLSACRSAGGEVTEADGVFGLARGFFAAGARAVVASLIPVRDDEAAAIAEALASRLAAGKSVTEALAEARRERMEAGDAAAAWGAFVVLGDPDAALETRPALRGLAIAAAIVGALLALAIGVGRFRSS